MEQKRLTIYSHNKVWLIEQKIYSFGNLVLSIPIPVKDATYFALIAGLMYLLHMTIPVISMVPALIKYIAIPFGLSQFLLKMKLDGKPPHKFLAAWLKLVVTRGQYIERFSTHKNGEKGKLHLIWLCSRGPEKEAASCV